MNSNPTPDRETALRNLDALIEKQGQPPHYLEQENGYLMGLKDARRILNGEAPEHDMSE